MSEKEIMEKLESIESNQKNSEIVSNFSFAIIGMLAGWNFFVAATTCAAKGTAIALIIVGFGVLIYSLIKCFIVKKATRKQKS